MTTSRRKSTPRRKFLRRGLQGVVAAGTFGIMMRRGEAAPNERVRVASIGINGMGQTHVGSLNDRKDARIVTVCDVDPTVTRRSAKRIEDATGEAPRQVADFRQVLDDESIDAVVIATPHHWHVPIAVRAMAAGKDVYCEKPMSHVFREGRVLIEAAKKHGRIVQHGTQTRSAGFTKEAMKVLESGILGEIKMTKAWNCQRLRELEPVPDSDPPAGVSYDMWLGPAPKREFNRNRFHRTWRGYRDYGNGDIGDDGVHDLDIARLALGVKTHPERITAHGSRIDLGGEREYPDNMMVAYHYGDPLGRGGGEGKVLLYEDRLWTPYGLHGFDSGNAFYGTKGYMIFSRRGHFQVYFGPRDAKGPSTKGGGPRAALHMQNFIECVKSRKQPIADAEAGHLTCGLVHLGEVAYRVGRVLNFDAKTETVKGDKQANALLTKEYRTPWSV